MWPLIFSLKSYEFLLKADIIPRAVLLHCVAYHFSFGISLVYCFWGLVDQLQLECGKSWTVSICDVDISWTVILIESSMLFHWDLLCWLGNLTLHLHVTPIFILETHKWTVGWQARHSWANMYSIGVVVYLFSVHLAFINLSYSFLEIIKQFLSLYCNLIWLDVSTPRKQTAFLMKDKC